MQLYLSLHPKPMPKLCKPAGIHDAAQGCMRHMFREGLLELGQIVGRMTRPISNFAAKMELTVLFN